jgi:glycosyltransferase involved in cell wall biosynthesis
MRILHTPVRLFSTGGVENYVCNLSKELVRMGHEVKVICAGTPEQREIDDRIDVHTLRSIWKIANTNITPYLPVALLKEDFDLIHTQLPTPWSADCSAMASIIKGKPLVLSYQNDIVGEGIANYLAKLYNRTALEFLLRAADRIIVARRDYLSPHLRKYSNKVVVVPIGVDTDAFRPFNANKLGDIFFLSILDEFHGYKGLDDLLEALKIIKLQIPDVKLVVGGSGSLLGYYSHRVKSLGIENNVIFAGFIPSEQLAEYYNGCKLFILPSTNPAQEGFGIVLLEAMACGKPVITTEIAGAAEDIIKNRAGIVVGRGNPAGLAEALILLLKNEEMCSQMGRSGRSLVEERYSWNKVAERTEEIYKKLVLDVR